MDPATRALKICEAARLARPELALDQDAFVAFLHARPERLDASPEHAGDLALSFACAKGDTGALRALDAEYLSRVATTLPSRHRGDAAEVVQSLRDKLLVPDADGRAKIGDFTGRGGLGGWLRVAAVRVALNIERGKKHEVVLDENRALAERAAGDLEIDHLKRRYRSEFREAFTAALEALEARPRNLLRQHYLDGLTMEAIGAIYRVHRITVVRWMQQAREGLAKETRRELGARLRVDRSELESILRLIESQLDVSLRAFLG
jgi:RNA polymerase sigma-70 factor, ECF subfamily